MVRHLLLVVVLVLLLLPSSHSSVGLFGKLSSEMQTNMDQLINLIGIKEERSSAQSAPPASTYESPKPSYKEEIHFKNSLMRKSTDQFGDPYDFLGLQIHMAK